MLDEIYEILAPMLMKKEKLRALLSPAAKKPRNDKVTDTVDREIIRPVMVDASTVTLLTPNW